MYRIFHYLAMEALRVLVDCNGHGRARTLFSHRMPGADHHQIAEMVSWERLQEVEGGNIQDRHG